MRDRDDFSQMLDQYHVSPGRESDISMTILLGRDIMGRMVRSKTPFSILLREQARYISPCLWVTQLAAVIVTILFSANLTGTHLQYRNYSKVSFMACQS